MSSVNKVILVGNLGQDPESIANGDGARFSLATNERWTDNQGNQKERTEWHSVVCWGKTATNVLKYLAKGRTVYLEGSLQTNEYTDGDGAERESTEIRAYNVTFLSGTDNGGGRGEPKQKSSGGWPDDGAEDSYDDDDIPF